MPGYNSEQRSFADGSSSQLPSLQAGGGSFTTAPQEGRTGNATAVKAPLSSPSSTSDKKQLPAQHTARKTIGASSKSKNQTPTTPHIVSEADTTSTMDYNPFNNTTQRWRPSRRQQLPLSRGSKDGLLRQEASSTTEKTHATANLGSALPPDFSLRPNKAKPTSQEATTKEPKPKLREDLSYPTTEPPFRDVSRNPQVPFGNRSNSSASSDSSGSSGSSYFPPIPVEVIDLTGDDDPQPRTLYTTSDSLHIKTHEEQAGYAQNARASTNQVKSTLQHGGKSIEAHSPASGGANRSTGSAEGPVRTEQLRTPKGNSNLTSSLLSKNTQNIGVAAATRKPTPQGLSQPSQTQFIAHNQKPQRFETSSANYGRAFEQPGEQNRGTGSMASIAQNSLGLMDVGPSSSARSASIPRAGSSTPSTGRGRSQPNSTSSSRTMGAEREIPEGSGSNSRNISRASLDSQHFNSDASASRPEPRTIAGSKRRHSSREEPDPTQLVPDSRTIQSSISRKRRISVAEAIVQPAVLPQEVKSRNDTGGPNDEVKSVSSLEATLQTAASQSQNRKVLTPEERRQALVSKHDPAKFDSYIYGKMNEPFRPDSTSYDMPEWRQPPRPTRPAEVFAHIDPRIHWNHSRTDEWHREKQKEIRERGNKKSNFGRAAARSAERKRQERKSDSAPIVDLPERVRTNPQWMAALEEMQEMEEASRAHKRKEKLEKLKKKGGI
ncbi:hypothetical protein M426DRAFT_25890 [Hypoxylon sp. CI-4A]|nr:hypothetical protein M426DRAFT_25890 [Hypoxylon sp. CI-4A]